MSFERPDAFLLKMEREQSSGNETFDAKVVEQWEADRPDIEDFVDLYGEQAVAEDKEFIQSRERQWSARPRASMQLEYMTLDGIQSRNWLGQNAEATPTNRYDDAHGVDVVVRFNRDEGDPLFLGIDVTAAEDPSVLRDKVVTTALSLDKGHLAKVKYYGERGTSPRGTIFLPRVVIGTDHENVERLFADFVGALEKKTRMDVVDSHPIQLGMIHQMQKQLVTFAEVAIDTYIRRRQRTVAATPELENAQALLRTVHSMTPSHELDSKEWSDLTAALVASRAVMTERQDPYGRAVFAHLDLLAELNEIEKQKRSSGVEAEETREGTEAILEDSPKELLPQAA